MDFKQLEAYVRVVELASFSKAAEAIFLSQPSVSTYISALEKELDATLINRSTKEVSPTLAGKIFYENAKELLALKCNATERIKNLSGNYKGEINILASSVPSQHILPEVIARFNAAYPDITFNVRQADTLEVSHGILLGQAEIGFTGGIVENDKCIFCEFTTEQMIVIAPSDGKLTSSQTYSLKDLMHNQRFVAREKGSGTRAQYENFFASLGIDLEKINCCASFDNTQSIINAVISGLGISVVSEVAARAAIKQGMVVLIKLEEKLPQRSFYYVLRKNFATSHLVDLFVDYLVNGHPKHMTYHSYEINHAAS